MTKKMTDKEYREEMKNNSNEYRAAVRMMEIMEADGMFKCTVCGESWKQEKTVIKHLFNEHRETLEINVAKAEEAKEAHAKEYALDRVLEWFPKIETEFKKDKAEFLKKMADENLTYHLSWHCEDMIKAEKNLVWASEFGAIVDFYKEDGKWAECLEAVKSRQREIERNLLEYMPRHSSTSLMSNAIEQWEAEAKAKLVAGTFSGLRELKYHLNTLAK